MDCLEFAATYDISGDTLSGVVHAFGERTYRGGVFHQFDPTAFDRSIRKGDVLAFYSHDTTKPLARPTLEVRDGKLHYSMELAHQSYADDLRQNVAMGLMSKMSFGVYPARWKDSRADDGSITRLHTAADLFDISPVAMPAFAGTEAMLHAAGHDRRITMARIRARVLEANRR